MTGTAKVPRCVKTGNVVWALSSEQLQLRVRCSTAATISTVSISQKCFHQGQIGSG